VVKSHISPFLAMPNNFQAFLEQFEIFLKNRSFAYQDVPGKKIDFSKKFQIAPKMLGSCWA
jgi:hypothetical protein